MNLLVGIVSYGAFIPRYRIKTEEIAKIWGKNGKEIAKGLNVYSKSVPDVDEDVITISVESARNALKRCNISSNEIGAIYSGSESHPYAVKPTSTIVAQAINAPSLLYSADYEFACKAGTAAIQNCMGLVKSDMIKYGLAIGADCAQGKPGDALEYSASAGGAAYLIGKDNVIAEINDTSSYTTDTPDFWRREGEKYPNHGGRFTGMPAYFKHVIACGKFLMEKIGSKPSDYDYLVLHQPNGKFPIRASKLLGFNYNQLETALLTPIIGNTYSGSTLLGLASVLDVSKPKDRIFVVSYGSGAGSDAFDITVTNKIKDLNNNGSTVKSMIENEKYIDYGTYAKYRSKIIFGGE